MSKVVPIRGVHESWRSLLGEVMADDDIESVIVVTLQKDGTNHFAQFNMTREQMAWAALLIQHEAVQE